jgi:hypothetical protein
MLVWFFGGGATLLQAVDAAADAQWGLASVFLRMALFFTAFKDQGALRFFCV